MATIRKRLLPSGKAVWQADYLDGAGTRRHRQFATKKDADAFLTRAKSEVLAGVHIPDSASVTVRAGGDLWIASAEAAGLERSTREQYRQHLDLHIVPFLGGALLSRLNTPAVRAFEDQLREAGRSPAMVKKIRGSLGALLADAQERGLVGRNVVRELGGRRRQGREGRAERRQKGKLKVGVDIPTRGEVKAIVDHVSGRWRPLIITAIFAGLRASEIRGLRWADVDLATRQLNVRQRADRYNAIGRPKSESAERTVPVPPIVINALREWKLACPKGPLAFPNGAGKVESLANVINRGLIPAQLAAGVIIEERPLDEAGEPLLDAPGHPLVIRKAKYTGMHALRHFYASWCINRRSEGGLELPAKMVHAPGPLFDRRYDGHIWPPVSGGG